MRWSPLFSALCELIWQKCWLTFDLELGQPCTKFQSNRSTDGQDDATFEDNSHQPKLKGRSLHINHVERDDFANHWSLFSRQNAWSHLLFTLLSFYAYAGRLRELTGRREKSVSTRWTNWDKTSRNFGPNLMVQVNRYYHSQVIHQTYKLSHFS